MNKPNDRERVERQTRALCEAGDASGAATVLMENYGTEIFRFLLSRLRDGEDAREVFSQFTEDLWRGLTHFRWQCSARVWCYTLARHAASRYIRDARRRRRREEPLSHESRLSQLADEIRTETLALQRTEVKTRFAELREQLSVDEQTLLVLRVNRKLAWKEIARVMSDDEGDPEEGVLEKDAARLRKRFQLAKDKLRELAAREGLLNDERD